MAEDLRQMHTEGKKIQRGPVRVVDVSGNKPGEYGRYAGNTVVPRSSDSGRLENGTVFPKVKHRTLNDNFQVEKEEMVSPIVDNGQRSFEEFEEHDKGMVGAPDLDAQESPEESAARIRAIIAEDAEIERKIAKELRIRQQVEAGRQQQRQQPTVSMAQYDPPARQQQNDMLEIFGEIKGMFSNMQEQIDDLRLERGTQPPSRIKAPVKPKDGLIRMAFSGDFGKIRTAYREVSVNEECIVLGMPKGELQSYEPPVNPEKSLKLEIDGFELPSYNVIHAGLSFDYKGDRLTVLLLDNAHGNS